MGEMIKVGIIGAGSISHSHVKGYQGTGEAVVAAVCDIIPRRAQRLIDWYGLAEATVYEDYRELLARGDITAVSICTPNDLHHPMTMEALAAGKHVICEKPLSMNAAQAREMAEAAESRGLVGMTGFTYHFIPSFAFAAGLAQAGEFGDIHRIKAEYTMGIYSRESHDAAVHWRLEKARSGGGVVGDLAAHILHMGRHIMGEAKAVTARLDQLLPVGEEPSQCSILVEYESGAVGNFEASWHAPGRNNFQRIEVSGSKGAFIYDFWKPSRLEITAGTGLGRHYDGFFEIDVAGAPNFVPETLGRTWQNQAHTHAMVKELGLFLSCIREGKPAGAHPDFRDGLRVQEIVDASIRSSAEGRRVVLG